MFANPCLNNDNMMLVHSASVSVSMQILVPAQILCSLAEYKLCIACVPAGHEAEREIHALNIPLFCASDTLVQPSEADGRSLDVSIASI
jgi:hypothetical protein